MSPADTLRRFLAARVAEGWTPGACWWIESAGRVLDRGAVGRAVVEPVAEDTSEATPYDLASLTKALCTAPLLLLFEQRRLLTLDSRIGDLLPVLRGAVVASATLLELATHTAGLPGWSPLYLRVGEPSDYLERIADTPPAGPRGTTLYSDLGYILLGFVLQEVGGQSLDRLFRRELADPLGLEQIGFARGPSEFSEAAATERGNDYERELARDPETRYRWRRSIPRGQVHDANAYGLGGVAGHAGLFGNVGEVAALARALLRPTRLGLGRRARSLLLEPWGSSGRTVGLQLAATSAAARGILPDGAPGHTGFTGTSVWLDPSGDRFFVLLGNRVHPQVPRREFHYLRRGFHRLACALR